MEISRVLPSKSIKNWNSRFVANSDGLQYENLTFTVTAGVTMFGNGTTMVDIEKSTTGDNSWNAQAYTTQGWPAPFTLEFVKLFPDNATDNSRSYTMVSLNTDPTTDANYTSLDYCSYPYVSNNYQVYHNGAFTGTNLSHSGSLKYYIVYAIDGFIYHYNGSNLLYSANTGSSTTLRYIDSSLYSHGHGIRRVRGIRRQWNGQTYV